jgi:hypothetical protein
MTVRWSCVASDCTSEEVAFATTAFAKIDIVQVVSDSECSEQLTN